MTARDWNGDGIVNVTTTVTWDSRGHLTSYEEAWDYNADGTVDYLYGYSQSFDDHGRLLTYREAHGYYLLTQSFDANGNQLSKVETYDWNLDGTADFTRSFTQTFNRDGNLLTQVSADYYLGAPYLVYSLTQTYDRQGNLLSSMWSYDANGDGTPESVTTTVYTTSRA